mmetsp:Transcript_23706/g.76156  ORF Transcript_23706/g.76156 Transcript_23706/m.76156 type:complete len:450 (+) Transcript_23706:1174-2523(+)
MSRTSESAAESETWNRSSLLEMMDNDMEQELLGSDEVAKEASSSKGKASWQRVTFVIITSFLGAGVLSLPYSASRLGWVIFNIALGVVAVGSVVASDCYGRLYSVRPKAKVFADIAREVYGARFERIFRFAVYVYIGGIVIIFHLTSTISLSEVVGGCESYLGLICGGLAFVALQARSMHDLSGIAIIGSIAILVPCFIILVALPTRGRRKGAQTEVFWPATSSLVGKGVGFMDLSFAYAGQVIFIELQSGMEKPKDFMKSVLASNTVMTCTYAAVAALGYYFLGQDELKNGEPISTKLAHGSSTSKIVNAFVFVHVLVAYAVEGNFLARGILNALGRDDAAHANTPSARATWAACTAGVVLGAYLISNLVPFFSDVMSFISGLCGVVLNFTFPLIFVLELAPPKSKNLRLFYKLLIALSVLVAIAGTTAATIDIVHKIDLKPPFVCSS